MIRLHFINVGHGDCTVIEFVDNQRTAIVDINRSVEYDDTTKKELESLALSQVDSTFRRLYETGYYKYSDLLTRANIRLQPNDPINYIKKMNLFRPFRFISTHPHMDHIGGFDSLKNEVGFTNAWILSNTVVPSGELSNGQKADWALYKSLRDSKEGKVDGIVVVRPKEGDQYDFWNADNIKILAPNDSLLKTARDKGNPNIMSYVLLIQHGSVKVVLGGDAEEDTWKYLCDTYPDDLSNVTILKAPHHGRDSGYYQPAVKLMSPAYTIVSVGKKPDTDATNKYRQYCDNVWSTRWKGNITFELNQDGSGTYNTEY